MSDLKKVAAEELDSVVGGRSHDDSKAEKGNGCLECQKGTHLSGADNGSKVYWVGSEGYCKNGHHYLGGAYVDYQPVEAAKWLAKHHVK